MPFDQLLAFATFSAVAAITPGPSNALLTAVGAQVGVRRGLASLFGVSFGMASLMFATGLGMGQILAMMPMLLTVLRVLGAALLLWLAWQIATAAAPTENRDGTDRIGFSAAAAMQWLNPKAWLVALAATGAHRLGDDASPVAHAATVAALFAAIALPCSFVWLAAGAALRQALRRERLRRAVNMALGATLAASVVTILR